MNIEHEFVVAAPIERVFSCFSTADGLAAWWPETATAQPSRDGRYTFGFDAAHQWAGVARTFDPPHAIEFEMTETSPMPDWLGTRVGARLSRDGNNTRVCFYHREWKEATTHYRVSSFCWAMYLRLLARYCTTGDVIPYHRRNDL